MSDKFKYSQEKISALLDGIYSGEITEYNIPVDLYEAIVDYLKSGLYKGFGGDLTAFEGKDLELLKELRENVYMFSGGKSYQQIKDYRSLLFDEEGNLRSAKEFTQLGEKAFETWNEAWGLTERQTAIGQGQMAVKWDEIQRNKDLLPIIVFDTNGKACPQCAPYEGFSAPVNDPIWKWLYPLLHFNCECVARQEMEDYPTSDKGEYARIEGMKENVSEEFRMNAGIDRIVFSDKHPYFDVPEKDKEYASNNFNLPIPKKD